MAAVRVVVPEPVLALARGEEEVRGPSCVCSVACPAELEWNTPVGATACVCVLGYDCVAWVTA